jgi:acetyl-CoA carboxylase carboxyl transferase subunit alpha
MKLTAEDLLSFGIIDAIVPEVKTGFQDDVPFTLAQLKILLQKSFKQLMKLSTVNLLKKREQKFRNFGVFEEKKDVKKDGK